MSGWLSSVDPIISGKSVSVRRFWTYVSRGVSAELVRYKETTTRTQSTWPGLTESGATSQMDTLASTDGYDDINSEPNAAYGWTVTATLTEIELVDITDGE